VCEILCYVQNNFSKFPRANLLTSLVGFYRDEELFAAKKLLFSFVESLKEKPNNVPRLVKRQGDNRRKMDCEDLLSLYSFLDENSVDLPMYVSANLSRVPSISPGEVDVFALASTVAGLTEQVSVLLKRLEATEARLAACSLKSDSTERSQLSAPLVNSSNAVSATVDVLPRSEEPTFADLFQTKDENGQWFVATNKNKKSRMVSRKITGKGDAGSNCSKSIKAVPLSERKKTWHVFVGRLDPSTTEEDVSEFLTESGISVMKCDMLKKTEEWQQKYAAFRVVTDYDCKDKIFDDVLWPSGADIRDWVFSSRHRQHGAHSD